MEILRPRTKPRKGFLDLPAELRNQIYELALVHHGELQATSIVPKSGVRKVRFVYSNRTTFQASDFAISLLLVNRQVNLESSPVLYGSNSFSFLTVHTAWYWSTIIDRSVRYLKNVRLYTYSRYDPVSGLIEQRDKAERIRPLLTLLERASTLEALTLPSPMTVKEAKCLGQLLLPMFRIIEEAHREKGTLFDLSGILQLTSRVYDPRRRKGIRRESAAC